MSNIHDYARKGDSLSIKSEIEAGVDPNIRDADRNTVLHIAVKYNQSECIYVLLKMGADLNIKNKYDIVPLMTSI